MMERTWDQETNLPANRTQIEIQLGGILVIWSFS